MANIQNSQMQTLINNKVISLNVGGHIYTTSVATLTRYPDSMLGKMFTSPMNSAKDEHGNVVIDRDGVLFRFVLNFLRSSKLILPKNFEELDMLAEEADFYQISELIEAINTCQKDSEDMCVGNRQEFLEIVNKTNIGKNWKREEVEWSGWTVFGQPETIKSIPEIMSCFQNKFSESQVEQECKRGPQGMSLPMNPHWRPLDRFKLFEEITAIGFELKCMSLASRHEDKPIVGDRWVFSRCLQLAQTSNDLDN